MAQRTWALPVDPECPEVEEYTSVLFSDPITRYHGIGDEVAEGWEKLHRNKCERCREYGVANIEMA